MALAAETGAVSFIAQVVPVCRAVGLVAVYILAKAAAVAEVAEAGSAVS